MTRAFIQRLIAVCFVAGMSSSALLAQSPAPAPAPQAGVRTMEVDPIRCWWKTSDGAVRLGQTFTLTLTCAVLQNEGVQVVPDESRLGAAVDSDWRRSRSSAAATRPISIRPTAGTSSTNT